MATPTRARWIAVVAVFGALWGAAEITLGALLRSAGVPLRGTLMTGVGVVVMLVARRTLGAPREARGSSLAIGLVTAAILPLSVSRGFVAALTSVLGEAACVEAMLWWGRPGRGRFAAAGLLAGLVPVVRRVVTLTILYGPAALGVLRDKTLTQQGGEALGLAGLTAGGLLLAVSLISAAVGLVCGLVAWNLASTIRVRLGRAAA